MTATTRNEAAERLAEGLLLDAGYVHWAEAVRAANDALAAERKASVERIRAAVERLMPYPVATLGEGPGVDMQHVLAILDEEAKAAAQ